MRISYYLPIQYPDFVKLTEVERIDIREELNDFLEELNEAGAAAVEAARTDRKEM